VTFLIWNADRGERYLYGVGRWGCQGDDETRWIELFLFSDNELGVSCSPRARPHCLFTNPSIARRRWKEILKVVWFNLFD